MMRQYWTPLARVLGLYDDSDHANPRDAGSNPASAARPQETHWPQLFEAFRRHALDEWVPTCKRHSEVSPGERMALKALTITPRDPVIAGQLLHWQQEGTTEDLIRWLVQGPWALSEIQHWVDFSGFESLTVRPASEAQAAQGPVSSRFDWRQQPQSANSGGHLGDVWVLQATTAWIDRADVSNPPPAQEAAASEWRFLLTDARLARSLQLPPGLSILGHEKSVRMPDGEQVTLKDQACLPWEGQSARYHAVQGTLVSGLHLVIRIDSDGVQCKDLGSTNGTFLFDRRLEAGQWTDCPAGARLYLGGPAGDPRAQVPCLQVARSQPVRAVPADATPLRSGENTALLLIQLDAVEHPIAITRLPFLVGRDPRCDWVIPAEHAMVSRQHLVIERIDTASNRIWVRDLSAQGLTRCGEQALPSLQAGEWIERGSILRLGASAPYPGIAFSLR